MTKTESKRKNLIRFTVSSTKDSVNEIKAWDIGTTES